MSCVLLHARKDLIMSTSEDGIFRVWDATKRTPLRKRVGLNSRLWILASHPEMDLFAIGYDHGMTVFKLERQHPTFSCWW